MATLAFYHLFKEAQLDGSITGTPIDFDTNTIKVALVTASYSPSASTHDYWADAQSNEVSGTNYTAGGITLTVTVDQSGGTVTVDASDITWSQSGTGFDDARYAIMYKDSGSAATSPLVGYIDFVTDKGNDQGDLTIQWNASGIFTLS